MKALVLAAGAGSRLGTLTKEQPKPMLSVGGKPLLEYILDLLQYHRITRVAINLHHHPKAIIDHFGDGSRFGVQLTYSHEDNLLGSAGAAKKLEEYLNETFLVIYGDLLTNINISALVDFHRYKGGAATIALYGAEDPSRCGIVKMKPSQAISRFVEKPKPQEVFSNLANAGVYVLEPLVLELVPSGTYFDFGHDLFPLLLKKGIPLYGFPIQEYLLDIGTPTNYERAIRDVETEVFTWRVASREFSPRLCSSV